MDPEYARRYRELYQHHWWWRARERLIVDTLRRLRPPGGRWTILDVGCGDGLFFGALAEFGDVEGVEPDPALVTPEGRRRGRIHVVPFDERFRPQKRYSLILMLDVLEHLTAPAAALRHAADLLEPGGLVLITVPAFMLLWTRHDALNHHVTRYTRRSFGALAREAGLPILEQRYFFHWLFAVKLGVRVVEAVAPGDPRPPTVPRAWVNRALYVLSRGEHALLRRARIPLGSSLLVLAAASR